MVWVFGLLFVIFPEKIKTLFLNGFGTVGGDGMKKVRLCRRAREKEMMRRRYQSTHTQPVMFLHI